MSNKQQKSVKRAVKKAPTKKAPAKKAPAKKAPAKKAPAKKIVKSSKLAPSIEAAVNNIAAYGDTDIFPFSFEQHIFHDQPELIRGTLEDVHSDFESQLATNAPENINTLAPVGYTGYRWATQLIHSGMLIT